MPERCDTCAYGKTVYGKQNFIRYLKFTVTSYYGVGGGLHLMKFNPVAINNYNKCAPYVYGPFNWNTFVLDNTSLCLTAVEKFIRGHK
jgi:hypothetical protein